MKINDSVKMTDKVFDEVYSHEPFYPFTPNDVGCVTAIANTTSGMVVSVHYKKGFATFMQSDLEVVNEY